MCYDFAMKRSPLRVPDINTFEPNSVERRIIDSADQLGLDPEHSVLVGSAALVLYGVQLPQLDPLSPNKNVVRPSDVDFSVDASHFIELYDNGHTPGGAPVEFKADNANKRFSILTAGARPKSQALPADLITRYSADYGSVRRFDRNFQKHYRKNSTVIPGTNGLRVATPEYLKQTLKTQSIDPKYLADLQAFEAHETRSQN